MPTDPIKAVLEVEIDHQSGPEIAYRDHVLAWLCGDYSVPKVRGGALVFWVCSRHRKPEDCECDELDSMYRVSFVAAK